MGMQNPAAETQLHPHPAAASLRNCNILVENLDGQDWMVVRVQQPWVNARISIGLECFQELSVERN